jgi:bifunctional UDP-N-acetylglucosamine pyrophosphorylase/glucosamine-1-phosphate N-acetyltransferase
MINSASVIIPVLHSETNEMNSSTPLVLHRVCGHTMLDYALKTTGQITDRPVIITEGSSNIADHAGETAVIHKLPSENNSAYTYLHSALNLGKASDYLIMLPGNLPLITPPTLLDMIEFADNRQLNLVALSTYQPTWYDSWNMVFCIRTKWLSEALSLQGDILKSISLQEMNLWNLPIEGQEEKEIFLPADSEELNAVIDRVTLADTEGKMRLRINHAHLRNGVTLIDPANTYIGPEVSIGQDTIVYPGNVLEGDTVIGRGCMLYPNNRLSDARIGDGATLQASVILESSIGNETTVGPYAYIRPGSQIGPKVRIGDFVEIKKSVIGEGTKVSHLTYIGDAHFGKGINVGCGVVCVNYDGIRKQEVTVGDHAFIGCNVNLIAPVEVENQAYIAAGSTITEKVPAKALAIARARQVNKEDWVEKREAKRTEGTE